MHISKLSLGDWKKVKSNRKISLADGKIALSPEGAELLIKEIEQYLVK